VILPMSRVTSDTSLIPSAYTVVRAWPAYGRGVQGRYLESFKVGAQLFIVLDVNASIGFYIIKY